MLGIAFMVCWGGYSLLYYGLSQIKGDNTGWAAMSLPWVKYASGTPDGNSSTPPVNNNPNGPPGATPTAPNPATGSGGYFPGIGNYSPVV